ncbi:Type 1 glutamine amidotransferase-like domain-containing protein [Peribacillus alkalitolerans]|uniref:Type 1 glutamine amidotransferase-like domain-containing protein n=1 Tax=Peribacillus alkalitolerans TaxID=1550385 RepID=UPI0013D5DBDD|nr:Type 1 glutamine amidotransferase-like domain-containing protein [Peribacillus alkalitolerans]
MKKLVLLSDLNIEGNFLLEKKIQELLGKPSAKLGYIPSQLDRERKYFSAAKLHFNRLGFQEFLYFDLDEDYDERLIDELLHCDAIYLSGGNTFCFLENLKVKNVLSLIRDVVDQGKLLIGMSAGGIIMSSNIQIAGLIDENENGLTDLDSLDLVDFDFMPHWDGVHSIEELVAYSTQNHKSVYACQDGNGLVVVGETVESYGDIICIQRGSKYE